MIFRDSSVLNSITIILTILLGLVKKVQRTRSFLFKFMANTIDNDEVENNSAEGDIEANQEIEILDTEIMSKESQVNIGKKLVDAISFGAWKYEVDAVMDEKGLLEYAKAYESGEKTLAQILAMDKYPEKAGKQVKSGILRSLDTEPHKLCRSLGSDKQHLFQLLEALSKEYGSQKRSTRFSALRTLLTEKQLDMPSDKFVRSKEILFTENLNGEITPEEVLLSSILLNVDSKFTPISANLLLKDKLSVTEVSSALREWESISKDTKEENVVANLSSGKLNSMISSAVGKAMKAVTKSANDNKQSKQKCSHCKKTGHKVESCWKKHPHLLPDKFRKKWEKKKGKGKNGKKKRHEDDEEAASGNAASAASLISNSSIEGENDIDMEIEQEELSSTSVSDLSAYVVLMHSHCSTDQAVSKFEHRVIGERMIIRKRGSKLVKFARPIKGRYLLRNHSRHQSKSQFETCEMCDECPSTDNGASVVKDSSEHLDEAEDSDRSECLLLNKIESESSVRSENPLKDRSEPKYHNLTVNPSGNRDPVENRDSYPMTKSVREARAMHSAYTTHRISSKPIGERGGQDNLRATSIWICDSGASHHMSGDRSLFRYVSNKHVPLFTADGKSDSPAYRGILYPNSMGIKHALFHQKLDANLISIESLAQADSTYTHSKSVVKIVDRDGRSQLCYRSGGLPKTELNFQKECDVQNAYLTQVGGETQLRKHQRMAHFRVDGVRCSCPTCAKTKSYGQVSHAKQRSVPRSNVWLAQCDSDFCGPFPESISGNRYTISILDSATGWVEVYCVPSKDHCGRVLREFCQQVGRPEKVRTDNEPALKGWDSSWKRACRDLNIVASHSSPYEPQQNSLVERWHRTMCDAIRANVAESSPLLWDWAARYVCHIFNRVQRRSNQESAYAKRFHRQASLKYSRRFGCLCFGKIHVEANKEFGKLNDKFEQGVFLGFSRESSSYLIGVWRKDDRCSDGWKFTVIENKSVKFFEDCMVTDLEAIKPVVRNQGWIPPHRTTTTADAVRRIRAAFEGCGRSVVEVSNHDQEPALKRRRVTDEKAHEGIKSELELPEPILEKESDQPRSQTSEGVEKGKGEVPQPVQTSGSAGPPSGVDVSHLIDDAQNPFVMRRGVKVRLRRGRPTGLTKAQCPHWAKPGRKKKESMQGENPSASACFVEADPFDDGEIGLSWNVQVTRKQAFEGPDSAKYMEADQLEKLQLEALQCWKPLEELLPSDEVIPSVVIYSRKRCGKFKARLVALGNLQTKVSKSEIYSPTISHSATRTLLINAAHHKHYLGQFDISNAFIRSALSDKERIVLRLPKHWSTDPRGDKVLLLKSLYGLRVAPRIWYDSYSKFLLSKGWERAEGEPGLFRRGKLTLAMYVDDSFISGPSQKEVDEAMKEVLDHFSGKVIPAETSLDDVGKRETRDILGVRLSYNRVKGELKLDMEQAIDKLAKKFGILPGREISTPCVACDLTEGSQSNFAIRSLVGGLQYIGTMCRPDVVYAINRVARCMHNCTTSVVSAAKRIVRYLLHTKSVGIEYSPAKERKFIETYQKVLKDADSTLSVPQFVGFSDSDFAGCNVTLRSSSGSILFFRGTPIAWSSRRQTLRAVSTCEAEYIGMYDTLKLIEGQSYQDWFVQNKQCPLLFCDNQSAITVANSSLPTKKTKHFQLRFHHVKEHADNIAYVPTQLNKSDPLTKPMGNPLLVFMVSDRHQFPESRKDLATVYMAI